MKRRNFLKGLASLGITLPFMKDEKGSDFEWIREATDTGPSSFHFRPNSSNDGTVKHGYYPGLVLSDE